MPYIPIVLTVIDDVLQNALSGLLDNMIQLLSEKSFGLGAFGDISLVSGNAQGIQRVLPLGD